MSIAFLDISSNNGAVDFAKVKAGGYGAVLDKSTEGVSYLNPRFAETWPAITAANLLRGAYHFARPDDNAPEAEAAWFLNQTPLAAGDVIALDVEAGTGDLSAWVLRWLAFVSTATGCNPWLYSNLDYLRNHGLAIAAIAETNGLWYASWGLAAEPPAPAPWDFIAAWQSGQQRVPGLADFCDTSTFYGDAAAWAKYGVPAAPTPKPQMTALDRYQLVSYVVNASSPSAIAEWVSQFSD